MTQSTDPFFDQQKEQSRVKSGIVFEYFKSWSKVMIGNQKRFRRFATDRIAYLDLYSGPGEFEDGSDSTPLMIIREAISNQELSKNLITTFSDKSKENIDLLRSRIESLSGITELNNEPIITHGEVSQDTVSKFQQMKMVPTLLFADPFGYKGLTLDLVNSVLKDWGCECIFFFNFNRVNAAITNPKVAPHVNQIFGEERAKELRLIVPRLTPFNREQHVLTELTNALTEHFGKYVLKFCFKQANRDSTSHYLIFVTKNVLGFDIMKPIMGSFSSEHLQGVPSFEFDPNPSPVEQLTLFRPMDKLLNELIHKFAGRTLQMIEIYNHHNLGTNYLSKNYKTALIQLKDQGLITTDREPRKGTFADNIVVSFPLTPPEESLIFGED